MANTEKTSELETLADFNSAAVTIATRRGASSIPAIENVFPQAMLLLFDTDTEVVQAVVAGGAHANGWLAQRRQYWFEGHAWEEQLATAPDTIAACDDSFQ